MSLLIWRDHSGNKSLLGPRGTESRENMCTLVQGDLLASLQDSAWKHPQWPSVCREPRDRQLPSQRDRRCRQRRLKDAAGAQHQKPGNYLGVAGSSLYYEAKETRELVMAERTDLRAFQSGHICLSFYLLYSIQAISSLIVSLIPQEGLPLLSACTSVIYMHTPRNVLDRSAKCLLIQSNFLCHDEWSQGETWRIQER